MEHLNTNGHSRRIQISREVGLANRTITATLYTPLLARLSAKSRPSPIGRKLLVADWTLAPWQIFLFVVDNRFPNGPKSQI